MRKIKIKEVRRLPFELGQREIARACVISQGAVHNNLKKAATPEIHWLWRKAGTKNASTSSSGAAVGLGRVSASASGRIRRFPFSHSFNNKLDDRDHFLQNPTASFASLLPLIGFDPGTLITISPGPDHLHRIPRYLASLVA